jgi:RNA polymerase sigma-70 factor (ECF subfamily)
VAQEAGWYGAIPLAHSQEGDLERLVREHARLVYRVAFSVLRHHHDAEDAVQETFMRVLRYESKVKEVREPKTWLARIAWRVAVDRRKKLPEVAIDEMAGMELLSAAVAADETVLNTEAVEILQKLMSALPAGLRDPLALSTVDEMSTAEVGEVLGLTEAAVRSRLFRAREILREKLTTLMEVKRDK